MGADESFQPVIQEQIKVFLSQNPDVKIKVIYKRESKCIRDLLDNCIQMMIISRGLTPKEETFMQAKNSYYVPKFELISYDALAVIVHPKALKKRFKIEELRSLLKGNNKKR
nr:substrate-binding domain-containing protein [Bacteroidetes bacterium endosymbiont of Geopemphigus sp.]